MSYRVSVQEKVSEILVSEFGVDAVRAGAAGDLACRVEGMDVLLDVFTRGEDAAGGTIVSVYAPIGAEVEITPELLGWVAQHSGAWVFGHVVVTPDAEAPERCFLTMSHNLLGESLDHAGLTAVLIAVAASAAELSRQVQERFGGRAVPTA